MLKRSLVARIVAAFTPIDLFFATSIGIALYGLFDARTPGGYWTVFVVLTILRLAGWLLLDVRHLRPASRFERAGERASAAEIQAADRAVTRTPLRMGTVYGVMWGAKLLMVVGYLVYLHPAPQTLNPYGGPGSLLLIMAVIIGAIAFCYPLLQVLVADRASELSVLARERHIPIERPPSSLQHRIALLALALATAPTLFVASLGYSMAGLSSIQVAAQEAAVAAHELALVSTDHAAALDSSSIGSDAPLANGRTRTFVVDRQGRPLSGRNADPLSNLPGASAWLQTSLQSASQGTVQLRNIYKAVAFRVIGKDRVAVAVVKASPKSAKAFIFAALAFFITVLVWAPTSAAMFSRAVVRPIETVTDSVRKLVEHGRLSEVGTVPMIQQDEVGQLGHDFNALLDVLRALSHAAQEIADGQLHVQVSGRGDLPDAFRGMLESLRSMVLQMNDTSVQLASAAAEIFAATQEQEMAATTQSSSMREISQTMESLSESAAHVSEAVEGVLQNAERTLETTDRMVDRIGELSGHASRIGEILEVIREIADRSDLLALNGSLEASHAGDAGRGFALVASEMRRLAERVTASVSDVRNLVDDIRQSGSSTVMATEESKKLADATTGAARRITLVTQQQRSSTEQVSESVRELTEVVSQTVAATSQTRASAENLKDQADQLSQLVKRFRTQAEAAE